VGRGRGAMREEGKGCQLGEGLLEGRALITSAEKQRGHSRTRTEREKPLFLRFLVGGFLVPHFVSLSHCSQRGRETQCTTIRRERREKSKKGGVNNG
jgi:hypothetical protein